MDKFYLLKKIYGHERFRAGQEELIDALLGGRDVLGVMPTGAGKSICYQIPAMLFRGITIVVSPLISLMKDQVTALIASGVSAAYINSSLTPKQQQLAIQRARSGSYKIIYVAPERLLGEGFLDFAQGSDISMLAVDEAHCVSQWGNDFRPSYLKIAEFAGKLQKRPVICAFTATATQRVRDDIARIVGLKDPLVRITSFDRPNLYFEVRHPQSRFAELKKLVEREKGRSGIIYCLTRKNVEEVCEGLCSEGIPATRYHAGLSEKERGQNQEDFIYDRKPVMVATSAFGMGIDKSNVSFVFHYGMPQSIEDYYQQAGRAGRDGEPSDCVLLYSPVDVRTNTFLIEHSESELLSERERAEVREKAKDRLRMMTRYCNTDTCLRKFILNYFGEKYDDSCGHCGSCYSNYTSVDVSEYVYNIACCVRELEIRDVRCDKALLADILCGSERVKELELADISQYGSLKPLGSHLVKLMTDNLIIRKYLLLDREGRPCVHTNEKSYQIISERKLIEMKLPMKPDSRKGESGRQMNDPQKLLLEQLRTLRGSIAAELHMPAYILFSNASLKDMCRKLPVTMQEFYSISDVGAVKAERYGERFIKLIGEFIKNHPEIID